ncbi:hypothetical protein A8144_13570 [Mycobacterium leprae 3125609]|nr:hypothetical protein A8144_13570 [Mycobacterium leprae 3125609]OAX70170.1 hypothetical protein A3216_13595 [Mycobacterium leprae 7935681]
MPGPLAITCSMLWLGSVVNRDGAGAGMDADVGKQVSHHLVKPRLITGNNHWLFRWVKLPLVARSLLRVLR